jgi:predicted small integral membrane protein
MKLSFFSIFHFPIVFAQGEVGDYTPPDSVVTGDANITQMLERAGDAILVVAILIAVIMMIIGGVQYALARGENDQQLKAKRTLKWTAFGLVLAFLAYAIVGLITKTIG